MATGDAGAHHAGTEESSRDRKERGDSSEPHQTQKQLRPAARTQNCSNGKLQHPETKSFNTVVNFFSGFYAHVYTKSF